MRTISAKYEKGKEPRFRLWDNVLLLLYIVRVAWSYVIRGLPIRRKFARQQRAGDKFYVDE